MEGKIKIFMPAIYSKLLVKHLIKLIKALHSRCFDCSTSTLCILLFCTLYVIHIAIRWTTNDLEKRIFDAYDSSELGSVRV